MSRDWQWVGLACLVLVACSRSNEPLPNKNTNWLDACESVDDCDAGQSCLCGICTTTCRTASECGRDRVEASCVPIVDSRLEAQCAANDHGDAIAICAAACEGAADCEAIEPGLVCREAVCVQSRFAGVDAGLEAGMSGPDAAVGDAATGDAAIPSGAPDAEVADAMVDAEVADAMVDAEVADAMVDAASMPPDAGEDAGPIACAPCAEGWSCIDGVCAQILATDQFEIVAFVRDSERLYWVNYGSFDGLGNYQHDGSVVAMPIGGGEIVPLAEGLERPLGLQVDDGYAYWVDNTQPGEDQTTAIMRVALTGGTPEPITDAPTVGQSIAVDDTYVYFFAIDPTAIRSIKRVRKDGAAEPEMLIDLASLGEDTVLTIIVDGQVLYCLGRLGAFALPKDGGAVIWQGPHAVIAEEAGAVYFLDLTGDALPLYALDLYVRGVDGETLPLAHEEPGAGKWLMAWDIAVDSAHVYWTWTDGDETTWKGGGLARSDKSPGDTDILWSSELLVNAHIVLDDAYVYLGIRGEPEKGNSTVLRIAKQGGEVRP